MRRIPVRFLVLSLIFPGLYAGALLLLSPIRDALSEFELWQTFWIITVCMLLLTGLLIWSEARDMARALISLAWTQERSRIFGHTRRSPLASYKELGSIRRFLHRWREAMRLKNADLKLEKELLNSLLGNLREGVLCLNKAGLVIYQNKSLPAALVKPSSRGASYKTVIINAELLEFIQHSMQSTTGSPAPIEIIHNRRFYKVVASPIFFMNEAELYLIIIQDDSARYNTRRTRQEFLQNASHELKTPITSIRGYTETLLPVMQDEVQRRFTEGILRNVDRMERIIEDMVTIASLESRSFPLNPRNIDLKIFTDEIQTLVAGALTKKEQTLTIRLQNVRELQADPLLLEHLLLNLITNASRYSPEQTEIAVRFLGNPRERMQIYVCDRGPGIPESDREKIFERFYRVDADRSRSQGGTGLGLSIVRQIVRLHGGSVKVQAREGGGSCFVALI